MSGRFRGRSLKQSLDWKLILCYAALVLIGWLCIYASIHSTDSAPIYDFASRSGKQLIWILSSIGLGALIVFVIPPRIWEGAAVLLYVGIFFLLVAVIFLGVEVKGSRSWFSFGAVGFQPAELSKLSTSLMLAYVMSKPNFKLSRVRNFLIVALVIVLPMLAILAESETGSMLVYAGFVFMLYREGLSGWFLTFIGLAILLFVLTLTASPYTSILVLIGILGAIYCINTGRPIRLLPLVAYVIFMAFLPAIWDWILNSMGLLPDIGEDLAGMTAATQNVAGTSAIDAATQVDGFTEAAGEIRHGVTHPEKWAILLKIKPMTVLLISSLLYLPFSLVRSYRKKDAFRLLSVGVFVAGLLLVFSADFIFNNVLQEHQKKRIEVLLNITEDPSGVGYNVRQSMIAIGSGGLFGKGYLHGTQTTFGFVPEQSTDFIFCTVGEEWGFAGCLVVILLYVFMISRIIHDAEQSRENFTRIYGYCLACCLFMHLFINIGMTIGLMPVIGIPLPLLSYGGSSLWTFTAMIAIFIVLDHEEKKYF